MMNACSAMARQYRRAVLPMTIVVALSALAPAQQSAPAQPSNPVQQSASGANGWDFLPEDAVAVVVAHPRRVLALPQLQMMPIEVLAAIGKQELGLDPLDIERAVAVVGSVSPAAPPQAVLVLDLTKPHRAEQLLPRLTWRGEPETLAGRPLYVDGVGKPGSGWEGNPPVSMTMPTDRKLIVGADRLVRQLASGQTRPGPLRAQAERLGSQADVAVVISLDAIRPLVEQGLQQLPPLPPPFADFLELPKYISAVRSQVRFTAPGAVELALIARDTESADQLEQLVDQTLEFGRQAFLAEAQRQAAEAQDAVKEAEAAYMRRIGDIIFAALQPERRGETIVFYGKSEDGAGLNVASAGMMVGLLLPAVQAAREAARRMDASNNLKEIVLAFHNYHDAHNQLPTNITDDAGNPLLSWRVRLLPFFGQEDLYSQFHLDEPWDSEHNLPLVDAMPPVYQSPNMSPSHRTVYLAPLAEGTWLSLPEPGFRDIIDGMSSTIAVVEADADRAAVWSRPEDLRVDLNDPKQGLGGLRPNGFQAAMLDGSVRFISNNIDLQTLKGLLTATGKEPVRLP